LCRQGDNESALEVIKELIDLRGNALDYNLMGIAYYNLGMLEKALESYNRSLELDPSGIYPICNKAHILYDTGKYQEALEWYSKSLDFDKKFGHAYAGMAKVLHKLGGSNERALELYDKAIQFAPDNPLFFCNRGKLLQDMNMKEKASADLFQVQKMIKLHQYGDLSSGIIGYINNTLKSLIAAQEKLQDVAVLFQQSSLHSSSEIKEAQDKISSALENAALKNISDVAHKKTADKDQAQQDLMKALVSKVQLLESQNEFKDALIMQMMERLEKLESKQLEKEQKLYCITEVVYENELLNHPELLKLSVKEFGMSRVLDMSNSLSSELISEAIQQNNAELLLAGCISLDCSDVI
jgi:tetratricopeptide (TPR) repeat protein